MFAKLLVLEEKYSIDISDQEFIGKLFGEINNETGIINAKIYGVQSGQVRYRIQLRYDTETNIEMIADGYLQDIFIFKNGMILFPGYDEDSETELTTITAFLPKETLEFIDEYYEDNFEH